MRPAPRQRRYWRDDPSVLDPPAVLPAQSGRGGIGVRRAGPVSEADKSFVAGQVRDVSNACRQGWQVLKTQGPGKIQFWFIALVIGIAAGFAALFFRKSINWLQSTLYGTEDVNTLHSFISGLEWYWVVLIPAIGGLVVGLILHHFTADARARTVGDVILGAALHEGRVETRAGLASAVASLITLSTGGLRAGKDRWSIWRR